MTNNEETVGDLMDNVLRKYGISDDFILAYKRASTNINKGE